MADIDISVGELPEAEYFDGESILLVENQGIAERVSGAQIKGFLRSGNSGGGGSGGGVSKASELENDVPFVSAVEQSLTDDQKAQARKNIGSSHIEVEYTNIGSASFTHVIVTDADGERHRFSPVGKPGTDGGVWVPQYDDEDSVINWEYHQANELYPVPNPVPIPTKTSDLDNDVPFVSATAQTLTEEQKAQARENIGVENVLESVGGDTLSWDGNTEGAELVSGIWYKASGVVPTKEDFASGCTVTFIGSNLPAGSGDSLTLQNSAEEVLFSNDGMGLVPKGSVFIIPSDNYEFEEDGDIAVFPAKGVYFPAQGWVTTLTIPGYTGFAKKKIKEEYIPESVPNIQTAAVGQTIVVSEVDADGKPTKWEAVEFPAGGGDEEWELIVDYTVPETVNGLTIDKDLSGNSFELRRWLVLTVWLPVAGVTINHDVKLGFTANSIWGNSLCQTFSAPKETETMGASLALCGVVAGNQIVEYYEQAQNKTNVAHQLRAAIPNPVGREVTQQGEFTHDTLKGNATCLKLCGYQAGCVHAGSIIKMWGVRA